MLDVAGDSLLRPLRHTLRQLSKIGSLKMRECNALQVIACCGYWDNSIRCYSSDEGRLLQSVRVHKDIVTCIEVGSDGRTLASGMKV